MPKPIYSLDEFREKNPDLDLKIRYNSDRVLLEWVVQRVFDHGYSEGFEEGFNRCLNDVLIKWIKAEE